MSAELTTLFAAVGAVVAVLGVLLPVIRSLGNEPAPRAGCRAHRPGHDPYRAAHGPRCGRKYAPTSPSCAEKWATCVATCTALRSGWRASRGRWPARGARRRTAPLHPASRRRQRRKRARASHRPGLTQLCAENRATAAAETVAQAVPGVQAPPTGRRTRCGRPWPPVPSRLGRIEVPFRRAFWLRKGLGCEICSRNWERDRVSVMDREFPPDAPLRFTRDTILDAITATDPETKRRLTGLALILMTEGCGYSAVEAWRIMMPQSTASDASARSMVRAWKRNHRRRYPLSVYEALAVHGYTKYSLFDQLEQEMKATKVRRGAKPGTLVQTDEPDEKVREMARKEMEQLMSVWWDRIPD